jgi:hypothetical protein
MDNQFGGEVMMFRRSLIAVVLFAAAVAPASAQVQWGARVGVYTDGSHPFVGVEAITPITKALYFNPNLEWAFSNGVSIVTLNADVHYDFTIDRNRFWWVGAGPALVYENDHGSDTSLGANILGGIGTRVGNVIPYAQAKVLIAKNNNLVIAAGLRF